VLRGRGVVTSRANASDTSVLQAAAARCCINWASSSAVSPDAVSITWPRGAFQARAAQARTRAAAPSSQRSCSGHAQPVCLLLALRARAHLRPQHLQLGPVMPLLMHLSSLKGSASGLPPKVVGAKCANSGSHLPHLRSTFTSDVPLIGRRAHPRATSLGFDITWRWRRSCGGWPVTTARPGARGHRSHRAMELSAACSRWEGPCRPVSRCPPSLHDLAFGFNTEIGMPIV